MDRNVEYIVRMVVSKIKGYKSAADAKGVKTGTIKGGSVQIAGIKYPYDCITDIVFRDGDSVKCILYDNRHKAAIIGK